MLGLTVWQPWASAIAEHGKPVENRTWRPPESVLGERIAIHAGKRFDEVGARWIVDSGLVPGMTIGQLFTLPRGVVVCPAIVAGASTWNRSPWFTGPWGWELIEVRRLVEPVRCAGAQGLWRLDEDLERLVRAAQVPLEGALDA